MKPILLLCGLVAGLLAGTWSDRVDAQTGAQQVVVQSGTLTVANIITDGSAWTYGSSHTYPGGCQRNDSLTDTDAGGGATTNTQITVFRCGQKGQLWAGLVNPDGSLVTLPTDPTHGNTQSNQGPQQMLAAVAHGADPTAVSAGQATRHYSNRDGVAWTIGGHMNAQTLEAQIQDADGAQTNAALVTCGSGCKVVVTQASVVCDHATTAGTQIVLGFGASTLPSRVHTGVAGIVLAGDGFAPGGGIVRGTGAGVIGIGADGEDLRLTTEDPVGGACTVLVTYYTVES